MGLEILSVFGCFRLSMDLEFLGGFRFIRVTAHMLIYKACAYITLYIMPLITLIINLITLIPLTSLIPLQVKVLSNDHTTSNKAEVERVTALGGTLVEDKKGA